ncbi:MAG TPA: DUF4089 domain-containing protein [Xanthobacteraceae bacterium]|jgi:hypothetical protein
MAGKAIRKQKPRRAKAGGSASAKQTRRRTARVDSKRRARAAAKAADPIDNLVAASAQALRLHLDADWHAAVTFNLALITRLAALVDEFPLADDAEPGPVFHA